MTEVVATNEVYGMMGLFIRFFLGVIYGIVLTTWLARVQAPLWEWFVVLMLVPTVAGYIDSRVFLKPYQKEEECAVHQ